MQEQLETNLNRVVAEIEEALVSAEREPDSVALIAVTKSVTPEVALALCELGQIDLGESRIDSLETKRAYFDERGLDPTWHFVGHLQRNKAARVVRAAHEIHSVDSHSLLETIERHAAQTGRTIGIYLQVLLADEEAKHGFDPAALVPAVDFAAELDHVELLGLMTMAPLLPDGQAKRDGARRVFDQLYETAQELPALAFRGGAPRLSMGMSGDFREAIAAGSDIVRIGTSIFDGLPGRPTAP